MKRLFVWLASVSICSAQAVSIGPFVTEDWVEDKLKDVASVTNGLASVSYVDDLIDEVEASIPDVSGLATKAYVDAVSNAIPSVAGLATIEQVTAVSNLLPDVTYFATRQWVGQSITNAVDDLFDGDGYIMTNLVSGSSLVDKSITGDKLANNAVNDAIIANLSVSTGKLTNKAVTTSKLADNAVTKDKIDGSVTNWLATSVEVTNIVDTAVSNRLNSSTMAEVYDPAKTYFAGDYVTYCGNLYKCLAENTGTFDTNKWQTVQLYKNKLYDAEVEYIVLGQGAYISSGIGYNSGNGGFLDFSHRFMFDPSTPHTVSWANGHLPGGSSSRNLIGFFGSSVHPENIYVCSTVAYDGNFRTSVIVPASEFEEKFSEIKVDGTSVYLNGEFVSTATRAGASSSPNTSYLIGSNDTAPSYMGNGVLNIKIRFAETTLTKGGVLVRDFIPVRKGSVGYYYDRVSGQLFGNAGTGTIPPGPNKTPKLPSMDGVASAGTDDEYARFDHVHPSDTSKADKSYVDNHKWDWSTQITNPPAFPIYDETTLHMGDYEYDLAGFATVADATLTEIAEFSEWIVKANGEVTTEAKVRFTTDPMGGTFYQFYPPSAPDVSLAEFYYPTDTQTTIVAQGRDFAPGVEFSATRTKLSSSYQLGSQTNKLLQPAGDYVAKSYVDSRFITTESDPIFNEWTNSSVLVAGEGARSVSGSVSTAIGNNAKTYNGSTLAVGNNVTASDVFDVAVGVYDTKAEGGYSTAVGSYTTASGGSSVAIGTSSSTAPDAEGSVAIGYQANTFGGSTIAIGANATANPSTDPMLGLATIQLGPGSNTEYGSFKIGDYTLLDKDGKIPAARISLDAIAPAFSASNVYTNGDYVIYDMHLYECTNYTGQAGWRVNDWQQTTVTGILGNLRRILDAINGEAL